MEELKKIDLEDITNIVFVDGKAICEDFEFCEGDLIEGIKKLQQKHGELKIQVKKQSHRAVNRKPTFKFRCKCGVEVKSTVENLDVICSKCNEKFEIVE